MSKRILLMLSFVFSFMCSTVFAASNIVINDVETKNVKDYIIEKMALSNQNLIIEHTSDNNILLLGTHTENLGLFGQFTWSYENRLGFTFLQKGKDVILSYSETCTSHAPNGAVSIQPVGSANTEIPVLQNIKGYFNGMYLFGFLTSSKKKDGGYPITNIVPLSAFDRAGIKIGDIIMKVNDVKLKADRNSGAIDGLIFDKTRVTTQKFLIVRNEVEKTFTVTSEYEPPQFVKKWMEYFIDKNRPWSFHGLFSIIRYI